MLKSILIIYLQLFILTESKHHSSICIELIWLNLNNCKKKFQNIKYS